MAWREDASFGKIRVGVAHPRPVNFHGADLTAAGSILPSQNGMSFYLNSATEFATALPAVADVWAGWKVRIIVKAAPASASYTVTSATAVIEGQATVNGAAVPAVNESVITFTDGAAAPGDFVDIEFDGTSFMVSGQGVAATAIAFTAP